MNRISDLESAIIDKRLVGLSLEHFGGTPYDYNSTSITLHLIDNHKKVTIVKILDCNKLDWFDEELLCSYISDIKCLYKNQNVIIVLDPYDSRISSLTDEDNMIIVGKSYVITE